MTSSPCTGDVCNKDDSKGDEAEFNTVVDAEEVDDEEEEELICTFGCAIGVRIGEDSDEEAAEEASGVMEGEKDGEEGDCKNACAVVEAEVCITPVE